MQEKCSFLLAHVEITAILAVFWMRAVRKEKRDILSSLRRFEAKDGRTIDGNGMARIGRKNLGSCDFAAASGGSGISGCRAGETGKVQRERTIRLQFLAAGCGGESFYTVPENHFNCAVGAYTHNIPLSPGAGKRNGTHAEDDV